MEEDERLIIDIKEVKKKRKIFKKILLFLFCIVVVVVVVLGVIYIYIYLKII